MFYYLGMKVGEIDPTIGNVLLIANYLIYLLMIYYLKI